MKDKLAYHFEEEIHFSGESINLILTRNDGSILRDCHDCQEMHNVDEEKRLVIQTAAKLSLETFSKYSRRAMNIRPL